jgi:hypothetical protein
LETQVSDVQSAEPRGKVKHDSKGNAIWDWAIATGILAKATTQELLTTLTGSHVLQFDPKDKPTTWSGDPYNRP